MTSCAVLSAGSVSGLSSLQCHPPQRQQHGVVPTAPSLRLGKSLRRACGTARVAEHRHVRLGSNLHHAPQRGAVVCGLFGLGVPELVVIAGVAAVLFGPKQLPELGKSLGKTVKSFQQAAKEFEGEVKKSAEELKDEAQSSVDEFKKEANKEK